MCALIVLNFYVSFARHNPYMANNNIYKLYV